jgi:thiamine-phosphate pyrophosphorylase
MKKNIRGIHILLSASPVNGRSPEELAQIAVDGRASVIQLREKNMPIDELLPIAKEIRSICRDITFIVNDRADLAKIVEADGVHLGQDDLPIEYAREMLGDKAIIGFSCGSLKEAGEAEKKGADYIGFGHMFPTSSKIKISQQKSVEELGAVCNSVVIPVIAIGGITVMNARLLSESNIGGIAVLGAFSQAENPVEVIQSLAKIL